MTLAGVDGCPAGWLAVVAGQGGFQGAAAAIHREIGPLLAAGHSVIAVDMPIGLGDDPDPDGRSADRAARALLARTAGPDARNPWSRVFPAPSRRHLGLMPLGYQAANAALPPRTRFTRQAFNIARKVAELDAAIPVDGPVREVHPELSFAEIAGRTLAPKRSAAGLGQRREILSGLGFDLDALAGQLGPRTRRWGMNDLCDACIALWSAGRIADGLHKTLPDPPEQDSRGHRMAIHY